jgi:hypothetical protein
MPTLSSAVEAKSWIAPGSAPADASPAVPASPAKTRPAATILLVKRLRGGGEPVVTDERTMRAIVATISGSLAASAAVGSARAASSSRATPA